MSVAVVVVNYFTERYLPSLLASLARSSSVSDIVIFDNGSEASLPTVTPKVRILDASGANIGFAAAVNRAWATTRADHVLIVNPDVRMCPLSLEHLLSAARSKGTPIAGPRFFWDDERRFRLPPATGWTRALSVGEGRVDSVDGQLRSHIWAELHDHYWSRTEPFRQPWLSGACLLLDQTWLSRRGRVFDERFFMYFEDTDLCLEAMREGSTPLCVPSAEVVHYWNQSRGSGKIKAKLMDDARLAFQAKHVLCDAPPDYPSLGIDGAAVREVDIGECVEAPLIPIPETRAALRLEVAVEAGFVPFAQAEIGHGGLPRSDCNVGAAVRSRAADTVDCVTIPDGVWRRLQPGCYFARVRSRGGDVWGRWQWQRV